MSDAAIVSVVTGVVTITTIITTFLTLWVKLRYGVTKASENSRRVEDKIDSNTEMTARIEEQTNGALDAKLSQLSDHAKRISALESKLDANTVKLESVSKNIDSTRHEMRGHLQTIVNKLDLAATKAGT